MGRFNMDQMRPAMRNCSKKLLCTFDVKSDIHMLKIFYVILMVGIIQLLACKNEESYQKNQLIGHWTVFAAERDGKSTTLLNGAIFQFHNDGMMHTNVTGEESSGQFDLKENLVSFSSTENMSFEIGALHGDTLSFTTELQGMRFVLDLHRTNTESQ
jgi:hypothetical protein